MRYGVIFVAIAAGLVWRAASLGGWRLLLLWPAVAFGIMGVAYLLLRPELVGKRADGGRHLLQTLLIYPYFALVNVAWTALRWVRKNNDWDEVWPGVIVGRRLLAHERLDAVDSVIDLTCEFREPRPIVDAGTYVAAPTLDQTPPTKRLLLDLVDHCLRWPGTVYIHCAEGHGRAGTVAVSLAIARGEADTVEDAHAWVKARRRGTRLTRRQKQRVREVLPDLLSRRTASSDPSQASKSP
jgi:protein-tyrosine phosphatase